MKLVINTCFGGFGLSDKAYERLIELGIPAKRYIKQKREPSGRYEPEPRNDDLVIFDSALNTTEGDYAPISGRRYWDRWTSGYKHRSHHLVVQVVEELGEAASGPCAELKVIEIPDGIQWELDEYDGVESIRETHRSWA